VIHDALIIGGGPAGATAAILLARAGWSVALIEKKAFPRRKVCGEFISATSLPLLRRLGVLDAFAAAAGPPVRRVGLFARDAVIAAPMPHPVPVITESFGRALGREHLDLLLRDAAARAGAIICQPASVERVQRDGDATLCSIDAGAAQQTMCARIVIAAHGSWEPGALPTQSDRAHKPSDLIAFKAHFRDSALPADLMPLLAFPGGYGGMVTTDAGRVSLSCCIRRDSLSEARRLRPGAAAGEAVLRHIMRNCDGVDDALCGATLDGAWLAAGPIRPGIRARERDGMFAVGNAAGEAHPIVAEGISMAMQSAWLLCRALVAQPAARTDPAARRAAGRAYAADWRAAFALRLYASSLFAHLAMRPSSAAGLLPLIARVPGILTVGARLSGKARDLPDSAVQTLANTGLRG